MKVTLQRKLLFSFFAILIITILVYKYFEEYYPKHVVKYKERHIRPPKIESSLFNYLDELEDAGPIGPAAAAEPPPYTSPSNVFYEPDTSKWLDDTIDTFKTDNRPQTKIPFYDFHAPKLKPLWEDDPIEKQCGGGGNQEPIIEGFTDLSDFLQFLDFLFKGILAMICITLTAPIHIVYALIGAFYMIEAFFMFIIGFIENTVKTFSDFNKMMNDISRCGLTWNKNLRYCAFWYMLEIIGYFFIMFFVWLPTAIVRTLTLGKLDLNNMFISIVGVKGSGYRDTNGRMIDRDGILAIIGKKLKKVVGFDPCHFPPKVMEKCYGCDIVQDFFQFVFDATIGYFNILQKPMEDVTKAIPWYWKAYYIDAFLGKQSFCSI